LKTLTISRGSRVAQRLLYALATVRRAHHESEATVEIRTFVMASALVLSAFGGIGCSASPTGSEGESASSAPSELRKKHGSDVSLSALKQAMNDVQEWADGGDPCSFSVSGSASRLELKLTADGDTAAMSVADDDAITMKTADEGSTTIYRIAGVGEITVTLADDAFDRVEIVPEHGSSATCEIDM
jgi:hypothetical protein